MLAALAWCGTAAANSLSCRSVNGNVVCAAPNARSCQTVDGKTVCTSGKGDALQIFGGVPSNLFDPDLEEPDYELPEPALQVEAVLAGAAPPARRREDMILFLDTARPQKVQIVQ